MIIGKDGDFGCEVKIPRAPSHSLRWSVTVGLMDESSSVFILPNGSGKLHAENLFRCNPLSSMFGKERDFHLWTSARVTEFENTLAFRHKSSKLQIPLSKEERVRTVIYIDTDICMGHDVQGFQEYKLGLMIFNCKNH